MTAKRPRLLFRGLHALIWHTDDPNRKALERYLSRLGLTFQVRCCEEPATTDENHDLLFFDGDSDLPLTDCPPKVPRIAVVGSEAPSRLEWLLNQDPSSLLVKPIRPAGIYAAIAFAFSNFARRASLERDLERLEAKVRYRRLVVFAVLRLMRETGCSEDEAFAVLRRKAMEEQTTIEALSGQLVARSESTRTAS